MTESDRANAHRPLRNAHALQEAMLAVAAGLELDGTLRRIVQAATKLVDARYGVLSVRKPGGGVARFVGDGTAVPPELLGDEAHVSLGVPVHIRDEVFGNLYLTGKLAGQAFTEQDEQVLQLFSTAAGIAVENARLYEETRRRASWQEAASEFRAALLTGVDTEDVLRLIITNALRLSGADHAFLAFPPNQDTPPDKVEELVISVTVGTAMTQLLAGVVIPVEGSTCGEVFRSHTPNWVDSLGRELPEPMGADFGPALILPLRTQDSVVGVLVTARATGGESLASQVPLVATFAEQAAIALQLARQKNRDRELDLLADRDRIARDLHDRVIQRLFAIGLSLQSTRRRSESSEIKRRLEDGIEHLQDVIRDIRAAIFDLHGDADNGNRLRERLVGAIAELTDDTGLRSIVRMSGPPSVVPVGLADHAEAALREAISNVVRHAGADTVTVTVSVGDELVIDVTDDGIGIPRTVARSGLDNLARRAQSVGGQMDIQRLPGGGTRLTWSAPLL